MTCSQGLGVDWHWGLRKANGSNSYSGNSYILSFFGVFAQQAGGWSSWKAFAFRGLIGHLNQTKKAIPKDVEVMHPRVWHRGQWSGCKQTLETGFKSSRVKNTRWNLPICLSLISRITLYLWWWDVAGTRRNSRGARKLAWSPPLTKE